ncbi:hypothetical protein B0H16DRAFT_1712397 [Mycena metata]|uniref:Uncharacterized protein n=1 Tax=Mycena metata TaxID=1033252 RepID=A0AAD7K5B3_9AGAR|nr:hypothetical protein B0H16DRAFT_1712397 [Mycena metata]
MDFSSADFALAVNTIQVTRNGLLALNWLLLYEWLATLPEEVELWQTTLRKPAPNGRASSALSSSPCKYWPQASVMLMRAYAFTGRSVRVLVFLLSFYTALVGIAVWFFCFSIVPLPGIVFEVLGGTGCFPDFTRPGAAWHLVLTMGASVGMDSISLLIIAIVLTSNFSIVYVPAAREAL